MTSPDQGPSTETEEGPPPCILFKTPAEPLSGEPYHFTLQPAYSPRFVSVLAEEFHPDRLAGILDEEKEWEGVIITSRRGAEGWLEAVYKVQAARTGASTTRAAR
jgi:uroporphyrinogen-III synthase